MFTFDKNHSQKTEIPLQQCYSYDEAQLYWKGKKKKQQQNKRN